MMRKTEYSNIIEELANEFPSDKNSFIMSEEEKNRKIKEEYEKLLAKIEIPKKKIKKEEKSVLYRYRPINSYTLSEIINDYVFLANPETFNDPFDGQYWYSDGKILSHSKGNEFAKEYIYGTLQEYMNADNQRLRNNVRIASFSQKNNNMPMWNHYANRNRGVCLEYDMSDFEYIEGKLNLNGEQREVSLLPVLYVSNSNDYYLASKQKELDDTIACLIKHKDWSYEEEWRFIGHNHSERVEKMPVSAIYFGYDVSEEEIETVRDIVEKLNKKIDFYHMEITNMGLRERKI